ncbi:MAG: type II toxin-antitoxin system prevent-host-death family antitoxin [Propionibacteriaceae bacterium]|nr:type II toxin-antitoxin system prevent-host-death family antitoxin [Propionibacteriaceae bacterium]
MTQTIGSYEAKTHLPRLLDEVAEGQTYVITKHGRPVARLLPVRGATPRRDIVEEILEFRVGKNLGMGIKDAIEAGRKY